MHAVNGLFWRHLVGKARMSPLLSFITLFSIATFASCDQELIVGLLTGDQNFINDGTLAGVHAALSEVNQRNDLLSNYTLNYELYSKVKHCQIIIIIV